MRSIKELADEFRERRIIIGPDHFVLGDGYGRPGMHCSLFVVAERFYKATDLYVECVERIAAKLEGRVFDLIVTPDDQSEPTARILARALAKGGQPLPVYSMTRDSRIQEKSGLVLVHDDVINRGRQSRDILDWLAGEDLTPIGISSIFTRIGEPDLYGLPNFCAVDRMLGAVPEEECPLCRDGVPVNTLFGKGAIFCDSREGTIPKAHGM